MEVEGTKESKGYTEEDEKENEVKATTKELQPISHELCTVDHSYLANPFLNAGSHKGHSGHILYALGHHKVSERHSGVMIAP